MAGVDLLPSGIDAGRAGAGTTNVDINPALRFALASIGRSELLHLGVGADGLRVSTPDQYHVERQVDLPDRWVRGLAETPLLLREVTPVATVQGPAIAQLLTGLPAGAGPGPTVFLRPTPRGLRPSPADGPGTVRLAGTARLGAAARIVRFTDKLDIRAGPHGSSAWTFDLPGGRLLSGARRLADTGSVSGGPTTWQVRSGETTYDVVLGDQPRCTCVWEREHHGTRGPCKHILAVLLITNG